MIHILYIFFKMVDFYGVCPLCIRRSYATITIQSLQNKRARTISCEVYFSLLENNIFL